MSLLNNVQSKNFSGTGRYLLFGRVGWEAIGGMSDFLFSFDTKKGGKAGMQHLRELKSSSNDYTIYDFYQILDIQTRMYTNFNITERDLDFWLSDDESQL